jgi:hypothetical protein
VCIRSRKDSASRPKMSQAIRSRRTVGDVASVMGRDRLDVFIGAAAQRGGAVGCRLVGLSACRPRGRRPALGPAAPRHCCQPSPESDHMSFEAVDAAMRKEPWQSTSRTNTRSLQTASLATASAQHDRTALLDGAARQLGVAYASDGRSRGRRSASLVGKARSSGSRGPGAPGRS